MTSQTLANLEKFKSQIQRFSGLWRSVRIFVMGTFQTDITVMDVSAKKFTDLTDFDGLDSWPMWSTDGHIYFVSDRGLLSSPIAAAEKKSTSSPQMAPESPRKLRTWIY